MTKAVGPTLSVVLPVTLHEDIGPILTTPTWRSASIDNVAVIRTTLLLKSFVARFAQDDLEEFFIVTPSRDLTAVARIVRSITDDPRYIVVPEEEVYYHTNLKVNTTGTTVDGWHRQQILKLSMAAYIRSCHYLTLDSDVICAKPSCYHNFISSGRAITNKETCDDYRRIYTDSFAAQEIAIKMRRMARAGNLLGCLCLHADPLGFPGETPVVLHTETVLNLTKHLTGRFERDWRDVLSDTQGWTEYSLYYHFLGMTDTVDAHCMFGGCNTILDLERSAWQSSEYYRGVRLYDVDHFAQCEGLFVAIQSWLSQSSWLPKPYESIVDFYKWAERFFDVI